MKDRRARLVGFAREIGCDTMVAFEPENLFYMTGFWGEAVGVLYGDGETVILAPELEAGRAEEESVDATVIRTARGSSIIRDLIGRLKGRTPCTDCRDYITMQSLKRRVPGMKHSVVPFRDARMIKDAAEIRILRKASRIIDSMFDLCETTIAEGQRESELQSVLVGYAAGRGAFDTGYRSTLNPLIIAGGPNGALPHAQVTNRRFKRGDLIVIDLTLRYGGYVSDSTRTFGLGRVGEREKEIYEIVRESQRLGLEAARTGVPCSSVDGVCRDFIRESGYGEYFIHSTGHGVGLDVHEEPAIGLTSKVVLAKDMAVTVEPGVYIPGKLGVRIEDSMIVGGRPKSMHRFTRELLTV